MSKQVAGSREMGACVQGGKPTGKTGVVKGTRCLYNSASFLSSSSASLRNRASEAGECG